MPFFAAFMIFIILWYDGDGEASFVPSVFMGACWNWLSLCPVSGWWFIPFWKWDGYIITSKHHILRRREKKRRRKKWREKRNVRMKFLQFFFFFLSSSIKNLDILPLVMFDCVCLSGQLEHLQIWRWFFLLCHEVAVPWIPTCGPLTLACEKRGARVRNRNETQVITPSDTTSPIPRGPEVSPLYFPSIIRSIK